MLLCGHVPALGCGAEGERPSGHTVAAKPGEPDPHDPGPFDVPGSVWGVQRVALRDTGPRTERGAGLEAEVDLVDGLGVDLQPAGAVFDALGFGDERRVLDKRLDAVRRRVGADGDLAERAADDDGIGPHAAHRYEAETSS